MSRLHNEAFGLWVRQTTEGLTLRQVENRAGVNYTAISTMREGKVPAEITVIKFAQGFRQDVPAALRLAGYEEMATRWETGAAPTPPEPAEPEHDPAMDDPAWEYYRDLPEQARGPIREVLRQLWERHQRQQTTHGRKAR